MKRYIIQGADIGDYDTSLHTQQVQAFFEGNDRMQVSDGYHTMDELYEHRMVLWITLCRKYDDLCLELGGNSQVWRSKLHSDGTSFEGEFSLGIGKKEGEQITYHLPLRLWDETNFAETLERAPEFDGHTPSDVLNRLKNL
jgi:hypothetical protein